MQVSKTEAVGELTRLVAGVLLTLMANLCQTFRLADMTETLANSGTGDGETDRQLSQYIALLDDSLPLPTASKSASMMCGGSRSAYASSFQVVLRGLLQHTISCSQYYSVDISSLSLVLILP